LGYGGGVLAPDGAGKKRDKGWVMEEGCLPLMEQGKRGIKGK